MKKKTIIIIVLCIAIILSFTILASYAYWKVSQTQTGTNEILGACLEIRLEEDLDENENPIGGFTIENAWPQTDEEGLSGEGYHFTVVNTCEQDVTYQVILDSLEVDANQQALSSEYVKVAIDEIVKKYSELTDAPTEDTEYTPIESKIVFTGQIPGSDNNTVGEIEHTIKLWISEEATNEEAGKAFFSKVRVIAGQQLPHQEYALTPGECFEFDESTGTIMGYDEENCTTDYLVVPQKINGVMVKNIDFYGYSESVAQCSDCLINWDYLDLTQATGLEIIGNYALCNYLGTNQELVIPDSVITLYKGAFQHFNGTKLILGNSIKMISTEAFSDYKGINTELVIPNSVETIGGGSFSNYIGTKLILGNAVTSIRSYAFNLYVGSGQELIIPDSVQTIGDYAFRNFSGTKLTLKKNITSIGSAAFSHYVGSGQELIIPDSVQTIGGYAFENYNGTKLILGSNVTNVKNFAFRYYVGTDQELVIPDSVVTIEASAFKDFNGSKLTLGDDLETIENDAFYNYIGTNQKLVIPNNVDIIYEGAFYNYQGSELVLGNNIETLRSSSFFHYIGNDKNLVIPNSVKIINNSAFFNFDGIKLTLGNSVENIGEYCFYHFGGQGQELVIPGSVKIIGREAFFRFGGTKLTLGNGIQSLGRDVFASYIGTIDVNMTESAFANVSKDVLWRDERSTLNYLQ